MKVTLRSLKQLCLFVFCAWNVTSICATDDVKKTITFATYNIHHGEGTDGKLDLERIANILEPADIIALQEVDRYFGLRSENVDQAEWLAKRLKLEGAFVANLDLAGDMPDAKRRQYGVALLSRYPIEYSRNHPLPKNNGSEQRGLLETQVALPNQKIRVFVTHLSHNSTDERQRQIGRIYKLIPETEKSGAPVADIEISKSWILAGDFNFRPDSKEYKIFLCASDSVFRPIRHWQCALSG